MAIIDDVYSPDTGEHIATDNPAPWMARAGIAVPVYNPAVEGCFFQNGAWVIVSSLPAQLKDAQDKQLALMDSAYATAITAPIPYMATTFQADQGSQDLITGVLTASGGALPAGFSWFDTKNISVVMTFADLQGLAAAMLSRGQPLFGHKQTQKAAIRSAATVADVLAVVW